MPSLWLGLGGGLSKLLILKFLAQEINKLVLTDIILSSIHMLMDVLPPRETCFFMVSSGNHLTHRLGWEAAFLALPVYLIFLFPLRHDVNFQRLQKFLGKTLSGIIFKFLFPVSALLLFSTENSKEDHGENPESFSCQFSSFHLV